MPNFAPIVKAGAKGVDALVDALRSFKFPQDEAMALAQQRAALPVEQGGLALAPTNTAAERAAAMGFDTPAYHGTNREFTQFKNEMLGANTKAKSATKGHFAASSPDTANSYVKTSNIYDDTAPAYESLFKIPGAWEEYANAATNADKWAVLSKHGLSEGSGRVIPLQVNLGNARVKDYKGMGYRDTTYADELTAAKRGKKDSVVFKHTFDAGGESPAGMTDIYALMSPDQIRSRFAAFDPWRKTAATAAAMGVAAPDLLASELRKK